MTDNQQKLLDFIRERIEATGGSPTYQEIQDHFGWPSKSAVFRRIESLIAQKKIYRTAARHRGLALTPHNLSNVPTSVLTDELSRRERRAAK